MRSRGVGGKEVLAYLDRCRLYWRGRGGCQFDNEARWVCHRGLIREVGGVAILLLRIRTLASRKRLWGDYCNLVLARRIDWLAEM